MSPARLTLAVLAVGAVAWLFVQLFGASAGPVAAPAVFTTSAQCAECHANVYDEWSRSEHANAWTGAEVRALSLDFSNQDCIDCHAPAPIFQTGIGNRVLPRNVRQVEGVDCIACHALPEGGVAGTTTDERAACRPVATPALTRPEFCAGCHNQHLTVDQWRASRYPEAGTGCIDCHMPHRGGDPAQGRSHLSLGGADIEMVRAAIRLRGELADGAWVVEIENAGAGHSFPTDERSRAADLFWRPLAESGGTPGPWRHLYRFRDPYRHEADLPMTLLAAHEVRRVPVLDAPADPHRHGGAEEGTPVSGSIEVALFYKRSPYYADPAAPDPESEARLVHRIELRP